jgi:hypothetical protein
MLGYMTAKDAADAGFTNHGSYYGIPIWIGAPDSEAPLVATKHAALEPLMTLFNFLEGLVVSSAYPEDEPAFMFKVGREIE